MDTHLEVEVKILNVDVRRVEEFLKKEQARIIFDGEIEQWHHQRPEGGARFRIRKETGSRNQFLITIKTYNKEQSNEIKVQNEEEFVVASKEEGEQLAKKKGFVYSDTVRKYRKEYQLKDVQICFDTCHTKIGDMPTYMEIESDREEIVFSWVEKLGFTKEDCVQKGGRKLIAAFENTHKPKVIIVNENDEIIGHKERGTLKQEDIYRVSVLCITNSKGDILLAQRAFTKAHHPGLWTPAVCGTLDEGETYESNIIKEAEEELGLKNINPKLISRTRTRGKYNHHTQWFSLVVDKEISEFTLEEDVEAIKWVSKSELKKLIEEKSEQFTEGFILNKELFF